MSDPESPRGLVVKGACLFARLHTIPLLTQVSFGYHISRFWYVRVYLSRADVLSHYSKDHSLVGGEGIWGILCAIGFCICTCTDSLPLPVSFFPPLLRRFSGVISFFQCDGVSCLDVVLVGIWFVLQKCLSKEIPPVYHV